MKAKLCRGGGAPRKLMLPALRVLGVAGLLSAVLSSAAGFLSAPLFLAAAGVVMMMANVYAIVAGAGAVAQEKQALQETQEPGGQPANGGGQ